MTAEQRQPVEDPPRRLTRPETLTELARMEAEGDAFYAAHPEIDPDEPHAVRVATDCAVDGADTEETS